MSNPYQKYVFFDPATGKILMSGFSYHPIEMAPKGAGVLIGVQGDHRTQYVDLDTRTLKSFGERHDDCEWCWKERRWVFSPGAAWRDVRRKRATLLARCDWTQLPDIDPATREKWAPYRQALRDITNQPDPRNIQWPTQP